MAARAEGQAGDGGQGHDRSRRLGRHRRRGRGEGGAARRSSSSCATARGSSGSARASRRAFSSTARRAPARRCSRRRPRTSRAPTSTRRAHRRSSRCSPGSGRRGSGSSSKRRARTRPRSSSSTSSTPSGRPAPAARHNREHDQTLNQLLVELDGFGGADEVVIMGASNRLQDLDPALLRPGRFDRQVNVAPPDLTGREEILAVHTRSKPLGADVDLTRARPADGRSDRRRPGEHRQRGGHLRGPERTAVHPPGGLRERDGAGRSRASRSGAS